MMWFSLYHIRQSANFHGSWYSIPVYPESLTAVALIHSGSQLIEQGQLQHLKFAPIIVHTISYQVIAYHDTLHSIALSPVASRASKQELGQTDQEISQSIKQVQSPLSQGPRVGPTCSHDLGVLWKCFGQGLDVQKSSVNAHFTRNPKKSTLVN